MPRDLSKRFDLRTPEEKAEDKAGQRKKTGLLQLHQSKIPVESYHIWIGEDEVLRRPADNEYWFADASNHFLECYSFNKSGEKMRLWVSPIMQLFRVNFLIKEDGFRI